MLKLVKSEVPDVVHEHMAQMKRCTLALRTLTPAQIRAIYSDVETIRDILSLLLDKADGKWI